jgi:hypothetical protein
MCNALVDLADAGAGAAHLKIYDSGDVLLADLTMSDPAFGAAAAGVATASAITDDSSANATGTADYFTIEDSDSNEVLRGSVGTSGEDLNLNTTSITAGGTVSVSSLTVTMPAA